jgi:hypothetical protein
MRTKPLMLIVLGVALTLGWAGRAGAGDFPATGQRTCYNRSGVVIPCADTGQDGDIQAGATLRYRDNGDGTIRDRNTELVWEKKTTDEGLHNTGRRFLWDQAFNYANTLNNICANDETVDCSVHGDADCAGVGGRCGFAGQRDWRLPNVKELQSIVNFEVGNPAAPPAFNTNCAGGLGMPLPDTANSSCTSPAAYWSSTTFTIDPLSPNLAWLVDFGLGDVFAVNKFFTLFVRAVRGGPPVGSPAAGDFPATGQRTCYNSSGVVIPCAGTGQDGDILAGAMLRYRGNGNGTIRDRNTELVWEKKSNDGGLHNQDDRFTWDQAFDYVNTLNNICANDETVDCSVRGDADCAGVGGRCGFAGQRDWRLPNVKELESIMNYEISNPNFEVFNPVVSAVFNTNCVAGSTVRTGSCTAAGANWSSTTFTINPRAAWLVDFSDGYVFAVNKVSTLFVRAVRGGPR